MSQIQTGANVKRLPPLRGEGDLVSIVLFLVPISFYICVAMSTYVHTYFPYKLSAQSFDTSKEESSKRVVIFFVI